MTRAVERQPTVSNTNFAIRPSATGGRIERTVYVRSHYQLFTEILYYEINTRMCNRDLSVPPERLFLDNVDVTSETAELHLDISS